MMTDRGHRATSQSFGIFYPGEPYSNDPTCEDCGRSIVTRFGEEIAPAVCDSCQADFDLLNRAGKLTFDPLPD